MSRLVEGFRLPHAVAGHPALELCNTRAIWWTPAPIEYLHDYATLVVLARELGVLTPDETVALRAADRADPVKGFEVLQQVLRLRSDVYAAVAQEPDPEAQENVRRHVLEAMRRVDVPTPPGRPARARRRLRARRTAAPLRARRARPAHPARPGRGRPLHG